VTASPPASAIPRAGLGQEGDESNRDLVLPVPSVDVLYAAPQAQGILNLALHQEYSPGIVFIFSQGRKHLYHV
jgi:hypothetical protein